MSAKKANLGLLIINVSMLIFGALWLYNTEHRILELAQKTTKHHDIFMWDYSATYSLNFAEEDTEILQELFLRKEDERIRLSKKWISSKEDSNRIGQLHIEQTAILEELSKRGLPNNMTELYCCLNK